MESKNLICEFSEIKIYLNDTLCIPSICAIHNNLSVILDFEGTVREIQKGFPKEKLDLLNKWIALHKEEIVENHIKYGQNEHSLNLIKPL